LPRRARSPTLFPYTTLFRSWTSLLPQVNGIADDVLRGSPLLVFADVTRRLDDLAAGRTPMHHDTFGTAVDTGVRALNPGLAVGRSEEHTSELQSRENLVCRL